LELRVQLLSRGHDKYRPLTPFHPFVAEVEVSVIEQLTQRGTDVVGDTPTVVDEQVAADEDDAAPAYPTQHEQLAQFG